MGCVHSDDPMELPRVWQLVVIPIREWTRCKSEGTQQTAQARTASSHLEMLPMLVFSSLS